MKIRSGFVSNSSTTSFIILTVHVKLEDIQNFVKQLGSLNIHESICVSSDITDQTKEEITKQISNLSFVSDDEDYGGYNDSSSENITFTESKGLDNSTLTLSLIGADSMKIPKHCVPISVDAHEYSN